MSYIVLVLSIVATALVGWTTDWTTGQSGDIAFQVSTQTLLDERLVNLTQRVITLEGGCADQSLNETVAGLQERVMLLEENLVDLAMVEIAAPNGTVGQGEIIPERPGRTCGGIANSGDTIVSQGQTKVFPFTELQASFHSVWQPDPMLFGDNTVRINATGEFWVGAYWFYGSVNGGNVESIFDIYYENATLAGSFPIRLEGQGPTFAYKNAHFLYTFEEPNMQMTISLRSVDTGLWTVCGARTYAFIIKL